MALYYVARHAPGGLAYLTEEGTWTRERCHGETFDDFGLARGIVDDFARARLRGVHLRNAYSHVRTCRCAGRPRAAV